MRVTVGPQKGTTARVVRYPYRPTPTLSGAAAEGVLLRTASGDEFVVPLLNLRLIEDPQSER
ncbi:MAG: hypothetical protein WKH64_05485 [Chloroflexia bacterium]